MEFFELSRRKSIPIDTEERGTTMWRRNKLFTKGINMSAVIVVGLLVLLLATQSSNGQVKRSPAVAVTEFQVKRFPAVVVTECQVDQMPAVINKDDQVNRFPAVPVTECQVDQAPAVVIVDDQVDQINSVVIVDDQVDRIPEVAIADGLPGPWISELFHRALSNFTIKHVGSAACQTQSDMYDRHLRNHTSWAVRMAESWNRYPTGILAGNQYHMGIYDECVDVRHPLIGQYCLSEINLSSLTGRDYSFNRTDDY